MDFFANNHKNKSTKIEETEKKDSPKNVSWFNCVELSINK